ncbi:MAG: SpoIIE family protein phosphatase [Nitrospinae bacterium]|nr:SpoIIE family protein phosphatase [Nitrospinota bacterium]
MEFDPDYEPEFDSLKGLLLDMAQERSLDALLKLIVNRLNERDHLALIMVWLVKEGDICDSCPMRKECPDQTECLHLVASAGKPVSDPSEDWSSIEGDFRRIPIGVRMAGHIAATGEGLVVQNVSEDSRWIARQEWAKREKVLGFVGQPLIYKEKVLGVVGLFVRIHVDPDAEGSIWLRMIADHIAAAIANANAFEEIQSKTERILSLSRFAQENPNPVLRADRTGRVVFANPPAKKLLANWKIKEDGVLPTGLCEALASGSSDEIELEDHERTFSFEIMPVEGEDYLNIYGRDISERKKAQAELEKLTLEKERLESELKFANLVQKGFLPREPPKFPGYRFAAKMIPARFVGGDFFDFIPLKEDRLGILIGDVSGKGVSAALFMARLMSDFRYLSQDHAHPTQIMNRVNGALYERAQQGMFATALFLLLDLAGKKLWAVNAGHHSILVRDKENNTVEKGKVGGIPLGIFPDTQYLQEELILNDGDLVFLYTDGVVEPSNPDGEHFGIGRVSDLVSGNRCEPGELIDRLEEKIRIFTAGAPPHDDITLLAFNVMKER